MRFSPPDPPPPPQLDQLYKLRQLGHLHHLLYPALLLPCPRRTSDGLSNCKAIHPPRPPFRRAKPLSFVGRPVIHLINQERPESARILGLPSLEEFRFCCHPALLLLLLCQPASRNPSADPTLDSRSAVLARLCSSLSLSCRIRSAAIEPDAPSPTPTNLPFPTAASPTSVAAGRQYLMTSLAASPSQSPQSFATSHSPTLSVSISRRSTSRSPSFAPRSRYPPSPRHAPSATSRSHNIVSPATASVPVVTTPLTGYKDSGTQYTPSGFPPTAQKHPRPVSEGSGKKALYVEMQDAAHPEPQKSERQADVDGNSAPTSAQLPVKEGELAFRTTPKNRSNSSLSSVVSTLPSTPKKTKSKQRAKAMPKEYMKCNALDLGAVVADMLVELIQINDEVLPKAGILTRFHSR